MSYLWHFVPVEDYSKLTDKPVQDFFDCLAVGLLFCSLKISTELFIYAVWAKGGMPHFLIDSRQNNVGVAIADIKAGNEVEGAYIEDTSEMVRLVALNDIPLGHKIALRDIKVGETIIRYGRPVGTAKKDIKAGEHVHIHNVKSNRWGK